VQKARKGRFSELQHPFLEKEVVEEVAKRVSLMS
jgi:hypothetical protein